jgi:hypothetical protein
MPHCRIIFLTFIGLRLCGYALSAPCYEYRNQAYDLLQMA